MKWNKTAKQMWHRQICFSCSFLFSKWVFSQLWSPERSGNLNPFLKKAAMFILHFKNKHMCLAIIITIKINSACLFYHPLIIHPLEERSIKKTKGSIIKVCEKVSATSTVKLHCCSISQHCIFLTLCKRCSLVASLEHWRLSLQSTINPIFLQC